MGTTAPIDHQALRRRLDSLEADRLNAQACPSSAAVRRRPDPAITTGHRQNFQVDADRILHSLAYTRYIDKTQVFYLVNNDHITHRVLHVQLVAKISRTISRLLGLNEDLTEAIALGHDLGHPPFGHDGEIYLSRAGAEHGLEAFVHPVQSVRALDRLERKGAGLNLSLQVLDGILCHDGEVDQMFIRPRQEGDFQGLDRALAAKQADPRLNLSPMTLEGCIVRLADTISYIGRDVEDAIRLGLVERSDIPAGVGEVLGETNGTIVFRLVEDLVSVSLAGEGIGFSGTASRALKTLKNFSRERIYTNPAIKVHAEKVAWLYRHLFDRFVDDLERKRPDSPIRTDFLAGMAEDYLDQTPVPLQVRDYIAGMTDDYFLESARRVLLPERIL